MYECILAINWLITQRFVDWICPRSQVKTSNIIKHTKDYQEALSVKILILNKFSRSLL